MEKLHAIEDADASRARRFIDDTVGFAARIIADAGTDLDGNAGIKQLTSLNAHDQVYLAPALPA